jgi:hypothetical protein
MNNLTVLVVFILTAGAVCITWFVVQGLVKAAQIQISIVNLLTKRDENQELSNGSVRNFPGKPYQDPNKEQRHGHLTATE